MIKKGSKVKVINLKGTPELVRNKISEGDILTVREVKPSGGLLFEGIEFGFNIFDQEQGLKQHRIELI